MNLILTGLRGTGKTTIGRRLAMALRRPFFDTDQLIEQQIGESISGYVERLGWEPFRDTEHQVIARLAQQQNAVISTGGGTLTYDRNRDILKPSGLVILLVADPVRLARRLQRSYNRPPLTQENSLEAEMRALWRQREPIYRQICDVVLPVDAESPAEEDDLQAKVSALLALVRSHLGSAPQHSL